MSNRMNVNSSSEIRISDNKMSLVVYWEHQLHEIAFYAFLSSVLEAYCFQMCPTVSGSASLCIPKTLWTPYLKNWWREFHPILVTDVLGFIYMLIRFWGQKVKGQGRTEQAIIRKTRWIQYLHQNQVTYVPGPGDILIVFGSKCPRSRSQQVEAQGS